MAHEHTTPAVVPRTDSASPACFAALVANTDHRDADLLALIEQFVQIRDAAIALTRRAERFKLGGRAYNRLWDEAMASHDERQDLADAICKTKAQTVVGAIAKAQLVLEMHRDGGVIMNLPNAAIRELVAMLEVVG